MPLPLRVAQPAFARLRSNVLLIATGSRPALDPFGPFNVDYQGTVNLVTAAVAQEYKKVRFRVSALQHAVRNRMTTNLLHLTLCSTVRVLRACHRPPCGEGVSVQHF